MYIYTFNPEEGGVCCLIKIVLVRFKMTMLRKIVLGRIEDLVDPSTYRGKSIANKNQMEWNLSSKSPSRGGEDEIIL